MEVEEEGCMTPRHSRCRIPEKLTCPPAPKKKPFYVSERSPPKEGYFFVPPELESLFVIMPKPRGEACT